MINEYEKILDDNFIVKHGHRILNSGRHTNKYIEKSEILSDPNLFRTFVYKLAELSRDIEHEVITGPMKCGTIFASNVSILTGDMFVFPEKELVSKTKITRFKRGFDLIISGRDVLIIEDVITTGKSVKEVINAIYSCGGIPKGIVCIWNREGWEPDYGIQFHSIINTKLESFEPLECEECKKDKIL